MGDGAMSSARRHLKCVLCLLLLFYPCGGAHASGRKYGLFARDDESVFSWVRESCAVVLGKIVQEERKPLGYDLHVEVLECFKGNLRPGDVIFVAILAESGPDPKTEIGIKRYYCLTPNIFKKPGVVESYWCDWLGEVNYDKYGNDLEKLFHSVPQHELKWLNAMLAPSEHHEEDKKYDPAKEAYNTGAGTNSNTDAILTMKWVPRAELLARKAFWEKCLATGRIPEKDTLRSEDYEYFQTEDNGVCTYSQAVGFERATMNLVRGKEDLRGRPPILRKLVKAWLPSDNKGALVYKDFCDLPKKAETAPTDTSLCVIMEYFENGKRHATHFYMPDRLEIQGLIQESLEFGENCIGWDQYDKRLWTIPNWLTNDQKYPRLKLPY
jgi:hypothetical protein